jgi:hypothetical protein
MTETISRPIDHNGHMPAEPAGSVQLLADPDFAPAAEMLAGFVNSMRLDAEYVFSWLQEGIKAGGELAFISAMMAAGDYDKDVHPSHIMATLWHAYDAANEQADGRDGPAAFRRTRAVARARRPFAVVNCTTVGDDSGPWGER